MSACPRDAAARRRRGVLARAAYAMRKERSAGAPRLRLARAGSTGYVPAVPAEPSAAAEGSGLMREPQVRAQQVKQVARPQRCFESQRDQSANFEPRSTPYEAERDEGAR